MRVGASRGGIALMQIAQGDRPHEGRNHARPDDIKEMRYGASRATASAPSMPWLTTPH